MSIIKRVFGYIHVLLALAVGIQSVISSTYDQSGDVWGVLNYLMAIGVIAALFFSFVRWRDADSADWKESMTAGVMLMASVALFILFFEQWFGAELFAPDDSARSDYRSFIWVANNVMFFVVSGIVGLTLLRETR